MLPLSERDRHMARTEVSVSHVTGESLIAQDFDFKFSSPRETWHQLKIFQRTTFSVLCWDQPRAGLEDSGMRRIPTPDGGRMALHGTSPTGTLASRTMRGGKKTVS